MEITGTLFLKRRGDKLYFNLFADRIDPVASDTADFLKGDMAFRRQREEWLQPGVKVEAKGELTVSVHNGKPDISCRVEELMQYVPESDNSNQ